MIGCIKNDWMYQNEYDANVADKIKRENECLSEEDQVEMQKQREDMEEKKMNTYMLMMILKIF